MCWSSKVTPWRTLGTSPVGASNDAVRIRMVTCAPATVEMVPAVVVPLPPPTVPLPAVPPLVGCTLCAHAVLPPALLSVVLVAGVYMSFLQRLLTSVLWRGFQRPFFGIRAVLGRPFFGIVLWSFFGVFDVLQRPFFGVVLWLLSVFCCRDVSKSS